jgi:hypothetical protein
MLSSFIRDLTGHRFSRLTVIKFSHVHKQQSNWLCQCDCGKQTIVTAARLGFGHTTSCGCRQREASRENGCKNLRHGRIKTPEYYAYHAMIQRCNNPNYHHFYNYGGRGIKVCKRWLNSFENFFADMGKKPSRRHSLDRKNNSGNYTPRNCRWATLKQQANNRRNNV